jgi:hypothetical protein
MEEICAKKPPSLVSGPRTFAYGRIGKKFRQKSFISPQNFPVRTVCCLVHFVLGMNGTNACAQLQYKRLNGMCCPSPTAHVPCLRFRDMDCIFCGHRDVASLAWCGRYAELAVNAVFRQSASLMTHNALQHQDNTIAQRRCRLCNGCLASRTRS